MCKKFYLPSIKIIYTQYINFKVNISLYKATSYFLNFFKMNIYFKGSKIQPFY